MTGDFSMLIEVRFPTTTELDHFVGELQKFGKTKTQIVFSTVVKHRCRYWKVDGRDFESHAKVAENQETEKADKTEKTTKAEKASKGE